MKTLKKGKKMSRKEKALAKKILLAVMIIGSIINSGEIANAYATDWLDWVNDSDRIQPSNNFDNVIIINSNGYILNGESFDYDGIMSSVSGYGSYFDGYYGAHNNEITVNDGKIAVVYEASPRAGDVYNNRITINGGQIEGVCGGLVNVGSSSDTIQNNKVVVNGGAIGTVTGGEGTNEATVQNNEITINSGSVGYNSNSSSLDDKLLAAKVMVAVMFQIML